MDNFIKIYENALSNELCNEIIEWFEYKEECILNDPKLMLDQKNSVRDGSLVYRPGKRKDLSHFLNLREELGENLSNKMNPYLKSYIADFPNLNEYNLENQKLKVQKTPPHGGYHIWHHEHGDTDLNRILVWTIYLNDIPDGEGETEFLYQGIKVTPKTGKMCVFPAAFTHLHRGNPPYSKDKYIVTGWVECTNQ